MPRSVAATRVLQVNLFARGAACLSGFLELLMVVLCCCLCEARSVTAAGVLQVGMDLFSHSVTCLLVFLGLLMFVILCCCLYLFRAIFVLPDSPTYRARRNILGLKLFFCLCLQVVFVCSWCPDHFAVLSLDVVV